jgi:hypothetical protein
MPVVFTLIIKGINGHFTQYFNHSVWCSHYFFLQSLTVCEPLTGDRNMFYALDYPELKVRILISLK